MTTDSGKKPFHETIVDAIKGSFDADFNAIIALIKITVIPKNHDAIIQALTKRMACLNITDDTGVIESLKEQKTIAEKPELKVIFDEKKAGSHGDENDPQNTSAKLIERLNAKLTRIGKFAGADSIHFTDDFKKEKFVLTKGGDKLILMIHGNGADGGYLTVEQ